MKLKYAFVSLLSIGLVAIPSSASAALEYSLTAKWYNNTTLVKVTPTFNNAETGKVSGTVKFNCGGDGSAEKGVVVVKAVQNGSADVWKYKKVDCGEKADFSFSFNPPLSYDVENIKVWAHVGDANYCTSSGCPASKIIVESKASDSETFDNPHT